MEKDYLKIAGNIHLSYYVEAADILGINYEIVIPRMTARFETQGVHWFINNTVTPLTNAPSSRLSKAKHLTNKILSKADIPVPMQIKVADLNHLKEFQSRYNDIVVKPSQNLGGKGVSILPKSEQELQAAFEYAKSNDRHENILAEEYIHGTSYRILAIRNKVISVVKRLPAHIVGDGVGNIKELIELENERRKEILLMPIPIDSESEHKLKIQNLTLDTVPAVNEVVELRMNANLTTGGTTEECSDVAHPFYIDLALKTLDALDLEFGGIDLITPDITSPVKCAINEVNFNPGLRIHYKVEKGEVKKVAVDVMEYIRDKYIYLSKRA